MSSSDSLDVGADGKRANETSGTAMDGIEVGHVVVHELPAGTTIQQKRDACSPQVYRYRFPQIEMANSHAFPKRGGACHETEIYPDDTLMCASLFSTIMLNLKGAFDDRGTPDDFTDDKPRGPRCPAPGARRPRRLPPSRPGHRSSTATTGR